MRVRIGFDASNPPKKLSPPRSAIGVRLGWPHLSSPSLSPLQNDWKSTFIVHLTLSSKYLFG